jgi:hypothetical protein
MAVGRHMRVPSEAPRPKGLLDTRAIMDWVERLVRGPAVEG